MSENKKQDEQFEPRELSMDEMDELSAGAMEAASKRSQEQADK